MFLLPVFNAVLQPCAVSPTAFESHAQGQFCASCQRVVQDFSQSINPMADLAAARAAVPDGRVCGSFQMAQVQGPPSLPRRLKWFLMALVLVMAQGLTAREALAQVRQAAGRSHQSIAKSKATCQQPEHAGKVYGVVVEQMPSFRGGGNRELVQYIQQQIVWPLKDGEMVQVEGRVFASFTVGTDGRVRNPKIVKGLHHLFDAEVLRVLRDMPNFKPGRQNGKPTTVAMTVPITFRLE